MLFAYVHTKTASKVGLTQSRRDAQRRVCIKVVDLQFSRNKVTSRCTGARQRVIMHRFLCTIIIPMSRRNRPIYARAKER